MRRVLEPHGHFQLLFAKFKDHPVSSVLLIPYRETVIMKILGWSGLFRELRPNEALFWGSIQWAKRNSYRYLDFEGIDAVGARNILQGRSLTEIAIPSRDQLKYRFGGEIALYPEAYDSVHNAFYRWAYHKLKPQVAKQSIMSKILDIFRKR